MQMSLPEQGRKEDNLIEYSQQHQQQQHNPMEGKLTSNHNIESKLIQK